MEDDELELDTIGDKKTALFLIMSDTDTTFNFILAMVQSQLINLLCDRADDKYGGRLPVHVRLILDEFANIGQIPNFDKLIATIRSREISASIILQSQSQLKAITRTRRKSFPTTATVRCSLVAGARTPRRLRRCWARKPLTATTRARTGARRPPTD